MLKRIRKRNYRIEVRARNGFERKYQGNEGRASRNGICQQRERGVSARQPLGHNSRADDRRNQKPGANELGNDAAR